MTTVTQTLYEEARRGNRVAYDRLFALHSERLLFYIRARLGPRLRDKLESRDILQEAYLEAHSDFDDFQWTNDDAFSHWLCRITENLIRDIAEWHGAKKRRSVELPKSDPTGPVTAMDRAEQRETILRALDSLEEEQRQVLLLRYFEGLNSEETGARMNRPPATIRKLTVRALLTLRQIV